MKPETKRYQSRTFYERLQNELGSVIKFGLKKFRII